MSNENRDQMDQDNSITQASSDSASMSFGRIVEIVGIAGIILSLIFLGYELKRANDIAQTEAIATIYGMTNEMGLVMAENPERWRYE